MKNGDSKTQIIIAIIAAVAVIISALISLQSAREPVLIVIRATQTAKAELLFTPTITPAASTIANMGASTVITIVVTATPKPSSATSTPVVPAQTTDEISLNYLPEVQFTPKSYFIFSIIASIFVFIYLLMPSFEKPFGLNWLIYFSMIISYYLYLYGKSQLSIYNSILLVILTVGLGTLAYKSRNKIPIEYFRASFFYKTIMVIFLLPLAFSIMIAGWLQIDLLTYTSLLFSWNMTAYATFFAIFHFE